MVLMRDQLMSGTEEEYISDMVIDSTPQANTTRHPPLEMEEIASATAWRPDEHCLLMVMMEDVSGKP